METILTVAIIVFIAVFLITRGFSKKSNAEHYGGPIRNVKKIPITDCYKMCGQNDSRCRQMYPGDNVGKCAHQWGSCVAECYFSNAQRM